MMQLVDVQVFTEIARTGSFTAAATTLGMPKSSVARNLARLEHELGCTLLSRSTRKVGLTDAGRAFLPHARRLMHDCAEARHSLRSFGDSAKGTLLVTSPAMFGRTFIAPILPDFRRRHPGVRVVLNLTPAKIDIAAGQADVGIRLGPILQPDLAVRRLGHIDYWIVASPSYLAGRDPITSPDDLARHEVIELRPPAVDNRLDLVRGSELRSIRCVPGIEINDPESVRLAALAGGGIAALPTFLVSNDLANGRLVRVLAEWAPRAASIGLVHSASTTTPLHVRAFLDFLVETIGHSVPWSVPALR
jgi:DNA-binding transcriptional LysR family regulator